MAKKQKGNRVQVILECTEMKQSGLPGTSRYITTKNRTNGVVYYSNSAFAEPGGATRLYPNR